jgi:hypothetical protein
MGMIDFELINHKIIDADLAELHDMYIFKKIK